HSHGDGFARDILLAEEVGGGIASRDGVEGDESRAAVRAGAGFVEPDVAGLADAEDLQIDAAGPHDGLLVGGAFGGNLPALDVAVWDVNVRPIDDHVREELVP